MPYLVLTVEGLYGVCCLLVIVVTSHIGHVDVGDDVSVCRESWFAFGFLIALEHSVSDFVSFEYGTRKQGGQVPYSP
jgi:hypothetical protein